MSGEALSSNQLNTRPFMSRGVAIYFIVLVILTIIAVTPGAITIGLLLFILPGFILLASGTLLYYSLALLPAYFVNRFFRRRILAAAVAATSLAAAAVVPHYIDGYLLGRLVASDRYDPPTSFRPRSFELPYPEGDNYWTNWRRPESRLRFPPPPCADLCQQLLFNGNVDQVFVGGDASQDPLATGNIVITGGKAYHLPGGKRVIRPAEISRDSSAQEIPVERAINPAAFFKAKWRRFRLQRRETCPDTLSLIEGEFVRQVVGGRCLLEGTVDSSDGDAVLSIVKPRREDNPIQNIESSRIQTGPTTVTITERRDHRAIPVEIKTALVAQYPTIPFYFRSIRCGGGAEIPDLCLAVATEPFWNSSADLFEMIARRYGLAVAPTPFATRFSVPVSDDDRTAVSAILKQDYGASGIIPMAPSQFVASFVNARLKSGELNQDDIGLIRALLKQHAFAVSIESNLPPSTYQALKPLLPEMFERIAYRGDGQGQIVQSLDSILAHFPAQETDPYSLSLCREPKNKRLRVCFKRAPRRVHKN